MRLSKSRFMSLWQCRKAGWLELHRPDLTESDAHKDEIMETGSEIGELARSIVGPYTLVEVVPDKQKMIIDTMILIENGTPIIAEASFSADGCFCSTDLVKVIDKNKKIIDVYEVKSTTVVKPEHIIDMAFQYHVMEESGYDIRHFYHVHINSEYERDGELNLNELFVVQDAVPDIIASMNEVTDNLQLFKDTLDMVDEPCCALHAGCHKPYDCPYFSYCTKNLPSPNVFDLSGRGVTFEKKVDMYSKGIVSFKDILEKGPKINAMRINEVRCAVENKDMPVDMKNLQKFMKDFKYPINFLDFESYQNPIPEYDWSKPFIQIPFQYSLHVLHEDGTLDHKEYIAPVGSDARHEIRDRLLPDLMENDGTIVAYNAAFEKMVIKDLAEISPWCYSKLMALRDRFIDLMIPFSKQWIYKNSFKGSYSIKYVLPGLFPDDEELNYKNLDTIQNGTGAMKAYQNAKNTSKEEQKKTFERLYKYCGLDTYAMVKIFWLLQDVVAGKATI